MYHIIAESMKFTYQIRPKQMMTNRQFPVDFFSLTKGIFKVKLDFLYNVSNIGTTPL